MAAGVLVDVVGCMRLRDQGQGLGPGQRRPLARGIRAATPASVEQVEAFLALTAAARVAGVHVDAEGAAVDREARIFTSSISEAGDDADRLAGFGSHLVLRHQRMIH